jgi:hypothetical protein
MNDQELDAAQEMMEKQALIAIVKHQRKIIAKLDKRLEKLDALEATGVDNWEGYSSAINLADQWAEK